MPDSHTQAVEQEGVPQRRGADHRNQEPLQWIEEGPHATLMTPERVLALLGTFSPGDDVAQTLAEQVEIEVRRALAGEQADLLLVVRMLAEAAQHLNKPAGMKDRRDPLGQSEPVDHWHLLHRSGALVQAAQRLCLRHGFSEHGGDLLRGEVPALNPEHMLERVEKQHRDYGDTYRWLRAEAKKAGFTYICDAISFAAQAKKGGA